MHLKKNPKKKNPVVQLKLADELSGSISRRSAHGAAVSLKKLNWKDSTRFWKTSVTGSRYITVFRFDQTLPDANKKSNDDRKITVSLSLYRLFLPLLPPLVPPSLPLRPPCLFSLTVSRSLLALSALLQYCGKGKRDGERASERKEREGGCQKHCTISKQPMELW